VEQVSTINRSRGAEVPRVRATAPAAAVSLTRLAWRRRVAKATRWLHIYGSMLSLALVLFFAVTGLTLNHQDWFASQQLTVERQGSLNPSWLRTADPEGVDKLRVVEYFRAAQGLRGALDEFRIDDSQCEVVFKGPGYAASAVVDRSTGKFDVTESRMGLAALVNDLHKGRDTGGVWKVAIDVSAALLVFISLTGLVLLYFVHKYRIAGVLLLGAGALVSYLVYAIWVP
jgi:uncharacterized protein